MAICISVGDGDTLLLLPPLSPSTPVSPLYVTEHSHFLNDVRIFTLFPFSSSTSYPYHSKTLDFHRELH